MFRKVVQPFYSAYVAATFAASILGLFPVFILCSLSGSAASRRAVYRLIKGWSTCWLWVIGMPVKVSGTMPPTSGRYIVVANHISYLDTLAIFPALPVYFRALGKKEVSAIPVVGYIYRQVVVMVDRGSSASRAASIKQLWQALEQESSIMVFPEGTFNETGKPLKDFYDGAFRLAINTQAPILPVLLPDTEHRWHYSGWWKLWPGRNRAVLLPVVQVAGRTLADLPQLKQEVYTLMEQGLVAYSKPKLGSSRKKKGMRL